jgi:hypothetical protein
VFYTKEQQHSRKHLRDTSILLFFLFFVLFFVFSKVQAENLSSTNFQVENSTLNLGGGLSSSSNFQLISSIGENAIGESLSGAFIGRIGFLYFPEELVTPPVDPIDGGGGGGNGLEYNPLPALPLYPSGECKFADFNCDGLVNIEDLSILLYYFDKSSSDQQPYDLFEDGVLDIKDISIMFYYWDF